MVENALRASKGLGDEDLEKLRKKIRETKGDIKRGKSKLKLEVVESWYKLFLR